MILKPPFMISGRLMPAIQIADAIISIEIGCLRQVDGRDCYRIFIDIGDKSYEVDDLRSGCQGGTIQEEMESLLSFLGAAAESYHHRTRNNRPSENEDLFCKEVTEWAYQNSDEISMLACELSETPGLISGENDDQSLYLEKV